MASNPAAEEMDPWTALGLTQSEYEQGMMDHQTIGSEEEFDWGTSL